jgi:hypothetical protein
MVRCAYNSSTRETEARSRVQKKKKEEEKEEEKYLYKGNCLSLNVLQE